MNIWKILGIDATQDRQAITAAYRSKLTQANPEDHPEAFKELRAAYEQALALAKQAAQGAQSGGGQADQWMAQVDRVYEDITLRRDPQQWRELLAMDFPAQPMNQKQARDRLLAYLTHHCFLPHAVWQVLDETFHLQDSVQDLMAAYPPPFIQNMVLPGIHHKEQIPYDNLSCEPGADCDTFLRFLTTSFQALAAGKPEQAQEFLNQAMATGVRHPHTHLVKARIALLGQDLDTARQEVAAVLEQIPEDTQALLLDAQLAVAGKEYDRAQAILHKVLEDQPHLAQAKFDLAGCLAQAGKLREAKAAYLELLRALPYNQTLLSAMNQLNQQLLPQLEAEYQQNSQDVQLAMDLAWCCHQLQQLQRADSIVESLTDSCAGDLDYENLASKVKLAAGQWQAALDHLAQWKDSLLARTPEDLAHLGEATQMEATARYSLGQKEQAFAILQQATTQWPQQAGCWKLLAHYQFQQRQFQQALDTVTHYCTLEPSDPGGPYLKGTVLFRLNRMQESYNAFDQAMDVIGGRDAGCLLYQCRILMAVGQWKDAQELLEQLAQAKVSCPDMDFCQALLADHLRHHEEAVKLLRSLLPICQGENPPDFAPQVFFNLVCLEYESLDRDRLLGLVEDGLKLDPENLGLLDLKMDLLRSSGKALEAMEICREMCALDPHHPSAFENLGRLLQFRVRDYAQAAQAYQAQLQNRETATVHNLLGLCYQEMEQYEKAEEQFRRALEMCPNSPAFLANLGELYMIQKRYHEAEAQYRAALEQPLPSLWDRLEVRRRLSVLLRRTGRWEEAAQVLQPNIHIDYQYGDCRLVAELWAQAGQMDKAMKAARDWRDMAQPEEAEYLNCKGFYLHLMGRDRLAYRALERGARTHRECCFTLATLYTANGRYRDALPLLRRLVQDRPGEDRPWDWIAKCLAWSGDSQGAAQAARQGLECLEKNRSRYNKALYYTRKASLHVFTGEYLLAREELELAERAPFCSFCTYPVCKDAIGVRVLLLEAEGQLAQALELCRRAAKEYPDEDDFTSYGKRIEKKLSELS